MSMTTTKLEGNKPHNTHLEQSPNWMEPISDSKTVLSLAIDKLLSNF